MSDRAIPPQQGDEEALFERYELRLRRATAFSVRTSPGIVDDACAFAWTRLLTHQPRRATVFPYLRTVARNEALRLDALARSHVPLGHGLERDDQAGIHAIGVPEPPGRRRTAETSQGLLELRERLQSLPPREREAVFLRAAGWRYAEMAERLGMSYTRVNRLLTRADARMREMDIQEYELTPRGQRLHQIEQAPPPYILAFDWLDEVDRLESSRWASRRCVEA